MRFSATCQGRQVRAISEIFITSSNRYSTRWPILRDPMKVLVLDEPTNHLDLATKEMLVEALSDFDGTMRISRCRPPRCTKAVDTVFMQFYPLPNSICILTQRGGDTGRTSE